MGLFSVLLFGVGLSADAAGVALCEGLKLKKRDLRFAAKIAAFFGFFQMLMPIIGFYLGDLMARIPLLEPAVGWVAFLLLFFVAAKMLWEAIFEKEEDCCCEKPQANTQELFLLAVATSIDAMTVGVTFAASTPALIFASADLNVLLAAALIGCVTFSISLVCAFLGRLVAGKIGKKAEILGGAVLMLLSLKLLLENFGVELHF